MAPTPSPAAAVAPPVPAPRLAHALRVLRVRGTEAAMGARLGELTRAEGGWEEALNFYPRMPQLVLRGGVPSRLGRLLLATAGQGTISRLAARLERRRPPALRARSRAFMRALGRPAREARWLFVMDLLQNLVSVAYRAGLGGHGRAAASALPPACTTLAAWGAATTDGALLHARNFDFPGVGIWEQHPTVVFCTPKDGPPYGYVSALGADVAAVTAFNEAGLTVTTHTRFHRDVRFSGAGVSDLNHDIVRHATTLAEAEAVLRERPSASTWGLCVSSAAEGTARTFELTADTVAVVEPGAGQDYLVATNRYRSEACRAGEIDISPAYQVNSDGREAAALRRASEGGLDVDALEHLLGSHDDPHAPGHERAAGSVIAQGTSVHSVVVAPQAQELHVSVGAVPTGHGPWQTLPLRWAGDEVEVLPGAGAGGAQHTSRFASGAAAEGLGAFIRAVELDGRGAPDRQIRAALERAVTADPDAGTYRLLAGGMALRRGDLDDARAHLEHGLTVEPSPFYRGQMLLWASRVAAAQGDRDRAEALRAELTATTDPTLAEHRALAAADGARPPTARKLRRATVHMHLVDVS